LAGLADHPLAIARRGCGRALAKIRDPDAIPGLIQALERDPDPRVKSAAASALVAIGAAAVPALLEMIAVDFGTAETGHASWALAHLDADALPGLYEAIDSPNGAVRAAVVTAISAVLKAHGNPAELQAQAIDLLFKAVEDLDPMVRTEAATAIGRIQLKAGLDPLLRLLADPMEMVRRAGAIALGKLGDPRAIGILEQVAQTDSSNAVRILSSLAIAQIES